MAEPKPGKGREVSLSSNALLNVDALAALGQIVTAAREYGLLKEQEQTKRAAIAHAERVHVDRIRAAERTLSVYFEQVFAERAKTNDEMFARLDQAMEAGDPQMVHAVVRGIVEVAQASPLAGVEDFGRFWAQLGTDENPIQL